MFRSSGRKAPAGRATAQTEDRCGQDLVDVEGERTGAWCSIIRIEGAIAHGWIPSYRRVCFSNLMKLGFVAHLRRVAFNDQIEARRRRPGDSDDTMRVVGQVLSFAGGGPRREVEGAIHPDGPDWHDMRPAVRTHRCQPMRPQVRIEACILLELLACPIPRDQWRTIAGDVALLHRLLLCHLSLLLGKSLSLVCEGAATCCSLSCSPPSLHS